MWRIGIDLMGADVPPTSIFEAALNAAQKDSSYQLLLFCTPSCEKALKSIFPDILSHPSITLVICPDSIEMHEAPLSVVRKKKNSTLAMGVTSCAAKEIDAFISCGNTGALITASVFTFSPMHGIQRPALLAQVPSRKGPITVLDVGGTVRCSSKHLVQFALLGSAYHSAIQKIVKPKVALLNVGAESQKGTQEVRSAYMLLNQKDSPFTDVFSFSGNREAKEVFAGDIDVLVTNGFAGNIFLKTAEGIALFALELIHDKLHSALADSEKTFASLKRYLSDEESQGAIVAGVDGLVVKCHGRSSGSAIQSAIFGTKKLLDLEVIQKMKSFIDQHKTALDMI